MARSLDRARLVDGGVCVGGAERALELLGQARDGEDVRWRAPGNEGDGGVWLSDFGADELGCPRAMLVGSVAYALLEVGSHKRVENRGRGALAVVVAKLPHGGPFGRRYLSLIRRTISFVGEQYTLILSFRHWFELVAA